MASMQRLSDANRQQLSEVLHMREGMILPEYVERGNMSESLVKKWYFVCRNIRRQAHIAVMPPTPRVHNNNLSVTLFYLYMHANRRV